MSLFIYFTQFKIGFYSFKGWYSKLVNKIRYVAFKTKLIVLGKLVSMISTDYMKLLCYDLEKIKNRKQELLQIQNKKQKYNNVIPTKGL